MNKEINEKNENRVHYILINESMPFMDGFVTTAKLRDY